MCVILKLSKLFVLNGDKILKKLGVIFCFIFAFLLTISVVPNQVVLAESKDPVTTLISSASEFNEIKETGYYELGSDISFDTTDLTPIQNFSGVLDGKGHKLMNITFVEGVDLEPEPDLDPVDPPAAKSEEISDSYAIFINTTNAIIKNLTIENIVINVNQTIETESLKIATLVANAEQNTLIENCSINSTSNNITINSKTRTYVGGVVAKCSSGTQIVNCTVQENITLTNLNETKQNYVGGIAGYVENSSISFCVCDNLITAKEILSESTYIGGVAGYLDGYYSKIKNSVLCENITVEDCSNIYKGTIIGYIPYSVNMPTRVNLNYVYTTLEGYFLGNKTELEIYFNEDLTNFNVNLLGFYVTTKDNITSKNFYISSSENFDQNESWNFISTWQIEQEKFTLPTLQRFSTFNYSINVDESFTASSLSKPTLAIEGDIITISYNEDKKYNYGEVIEVGGYVTSQNELNKFFRIDGLIKDGTIVYDNQNIMGIITNEDTVLEEKPDGSKVYTLNKSNIVTVETVVYKGVTASKYILNGSQIVWYNYSTLGDELNPNASDYIINNCNLSDSANYCFKLSPIKYNITVLTDNIAHGTVKRSNGNENKESFIDEVSYGKSVAYTATSSTSDFGFNCWYNIDKTFVLSNQSRVDFIFNEKLFATGGMFDGLSPDDELAFVATFTKRVCDLTVKFAVNNEIVEEILSVVKIDGENIEKDGVLAKKVAMDKSYYIDVILPSGYNFLNWYTSDGTQNLGSIGDTLGIDLQITSEDESLILVANFELIEEEKEEGSPIIWIVIGAVVVLAIVGVCIFLILRKKGDNGYKKMYY